jgi:hypothetical protein
MAETTTTQQDSFMIAAASMLGIPLDPAWHDSVKFHLQLSLRMANLLQAFELPDEAEPAPVYRV